MYIKTFKELAQFVLSITILLFLLSNSTAHLKGSDSINPPSKVNWLNTMGCDIEGNQCVALNESENTIQFVLRIRFSKEVSDLTAYPGMQFYYNVGDGQYVGYTDIGENDMIAPVLLEDDTPANEIAFPVHISVDDLCDDDNDGSFLYKIQYQLVTDESGAYPIGSYPELFPTDIFDVPSADYDAGLVSLTKNVCCESGVYTCSEEEKNTIFLAYPNPFQSVVKVYYDIEDAGEISLVCLDSKGAQLIKKTIKHENGGIYDWSFSTETWPSGVYYIELLKGGAVETLKIIKYD